MAQGPVGGELAVRGTQILWRLDQVPLTGAWLPPNWRVCLDPGWRARHAADSSVAEGTVIKEVRAGFLWDDQVLRTAEVIVSKGDAGKGDR